MRLSGAIDDVGQVSNGLFQRKHDLFFLCPSLEQPQVPAPAKKVVSNYKRFSPYFDARDRITNESS